MVDHNTGDNPMRLPRLRPDLMLMVGDRPSAKYTAMPIAEGARQRTLQLAPGYLPPLLGVALDAPLGQLCPRARPGRAAEGLLPRRAGAGRRRRRTPCLAARGAQRIQCLVAGLPPFEAALNTGRAHPLGSPCWPAGIAGQVALLGPGMVPPIFDAYDHDDPAASFRPLLTFIERVLETISELHQTIAFAQDGNAFRLKLDPAWLDDGELLIGVRGRAGTGEAETAQWIEESLIGDSEQIQPMTEARIRGAARARILESEALDIVPTRGTLVFRIAADRNFIAANRVLEIANPRDVGGARRPLEIVLYVRVAGET